MLLGPAILLLGAAILLLGAAILFLGAAILLLYLLPPLHRHPVSPPPSSSASRRPPYALDCPAIVRQLSGKRASPAALYTYIWAWSSREAGNLPEICLRQHLAGGACLSRDSLRAARPCSGPPAGSRDASVMQRSASDPPHWGRSRCHYGVIMGTWARQAARARGRPMQH